jgi:RNA polymerase sigma factor (sigma-70 family)
VAARQRAGNLRSDYEQPNRQRRVTLDIRQQSPHDEPWSCGTGTQPREPANISLTRVAHKQPDRHPPSRPHPPITNANARNSHAPLDNKLSISVGRDRYRSERGSIRQWLLGIAAKKVVDAQRRGYVERRAQQQLGMTEICWTEDDLERVERAGGAQLEQLLEDLPGEQRAAIESRVLDERPYAEIASGAGVSEQVVRKRVSRGLDTIRRRFRMEDET